MKRAGSLPAKSASKETTLSRSSTMNTYAVSRIEHRELVTGKRPSVVEGSESSSTSGKLSRASTEILRHCVSDPWRSIVKEEVPHNSIAPGKRGSSTQEMVGAPKTMKLENPVRVSAVTQTSVLAQRSATAASATEPERVFATVETQTSFRDAWLNFTPAGNRPPSQKPTQESNEDTPLRRLYSRSQPSTTVVPRNPSWIVITSPTVAESSDKPSQEVACEAADARLDTMSVNKPPSSPTSGSQSVRSLSVGSGKRSRSPSPEPAAKKAALDSSRSSSPSRSRSASPADKGSQAPSPVGSGSRSRSSSSDSSRSSSPANDRARSASPVNVPATLVRIRSKSVSPPPVAVSTAQKSDSGRCPICMKFKCPFMTSTAMSFARQKVRRSYRRRARASRKTTKAKGTTRRTRRKSPDYSTLSIAQKKAKLFSAVRAGKLDTVEKLVKDLGPTMRRVRGRATLLHIAASSNQPDVVTFLLKYISPNIMDKEGHTPAHDAALKGHLDVLKILIADEEFNENSRDMYGRTCKDLLVTPLLVAVASRDKNRVEELLKFGADPDCRLPMQDPSSLTPRQMAVSQGLNDFVDLMPKKLRKQRTQKGLAVNSHTPKIFDPNRRPKFQTLRLTMIQPIRSMLGLFDYKMDVDPRGFVCFLNYSSFKNRPDLYIKGTDQDTCNLAAVLGELGYTGDVFSSMTFEETKEVLTYVQKMEVLSKVGSLIFVVTSHGLNGANLLTSDMKSVNIEWMLNLFKNSRCPQLKNKPKIFIFNLSNQEVPELQNEAPRPRRVEDSLTDTACIYASTKKVGAAAFSERGSAFVTALCNTLASHHDKEFNEVHKALLAEGMKMSRSIVPEIRTYGFSKRFFFSSSGTLTEQPFLGHNFVPIGLTPNKCWNNSVLRK